MPRMEKKIGCSGEMCEYGMFRIRYLDQIEFERRREEKSFTVWTGKKEDIGWDGNLAVAVYVEAQEGLFVWNRQECCHSSSKETGVCGSGM